MEEEAEEARARVVGEGARVLGDVAEMGNGGLRLPEQVRKVVVAVVAVIQRPLHQHQLRRQSLNAYLWRINYS